MNAVSIWPVQERLLMFEIGKVLRALKITDSHNLNGDIFMPSTGGRFLVTTVGDEAQLIHTARGSATRKDLSQDQNPGSYALVTALKHAYINVVPHLHRTMALDNLPTEQSVFGGLGD